MVVTYLAGASDVVVTYLAGASNVVDHNDELHPTFPLVGLVSMQHCALQQRYLRTVKQ